MYLLIALADSGIYDLVGRKTAVMSVKDLVAADAVRSEAFSAYVFEQPAFHVGLDRIVHLYVMACGKYCHMIDRSAEQFHVVEIERGRDFVKLVYSVGIHHFQFKITPSLKFRVKRLQK